MKKRRRIEKERKNQRNFLPLSHLHNKSMQPSRYLRHNNSLRKQNFSFQSFQIEQNYILQALQFSIKSHLPNPFQKTPLHPHVDPHHYHTLSQNPTYQAYTLEYHDYKVDLPAVLQSLKVFLSLNFNLSKLHNTTPVALLRNFSLSKTTSDIGQGQF